MPNISKHGCGLKIYSDTEVIYLKEQIKKKRCLINHNYKPVGHLYKNHEPVNVAIYLVCEKCGHEKDQFEAFATIERITQRKNNTSTIEGKL